MDDDPGRPASVPPAAPSIAPAAPAPTGQGEPDGDRGAMSVATDPGPADPWSADSANPVDPVDPADSAAEFEAEPTDWAWVEEWRAGGEPTPWGPGLALAGFATFLVASAVYVLSSGLADHPIIDIAVNVLVAAGLGPALWLSRGLPVLRWIAGGAILGVLVAWFSVLVFKA